MKKHLFCFSLLCALVFPAQAANNFAKDQLVAWCIVPFDAAKRGPAARAEMLKRLGIKRVAYDWRAQHVKEFEEEILQYKKHGLEFFAFWSVHEEAFALFEKYKLHPQIWRTVPSPKADSQEARVEAAAKALLPLVERTKKLGCKLGLYNHGGWGGEPANLVAVCTCKHTRLHKHHHGHAKHVGMKPYLQPASRSLGHIEAAMISNVGIGAQGLMQPAGKSALP